MSSENLEAFWKRVERDPELQRRLGSLPRGGREDTAEEIVRIASELGMPFMVEEFVDARAALSSEDLDRIAVGAIGVTDISFRRNFLDRIGVRSIGGGGDPR